jgi:hexosaminidase
VTAASAPPVFPVPRRASFSGDGGRLAVRGERVDRSLPPQGYRLRIDAHGTTVEHRDDLGLRYAQDTLEQLAADGSEAIGVVEDWPEHRERAYLLDISRDRVPTLTTIDWLVGALGRLRYTELQLYTEHTFAWPGHEQVWRAASPLTAEDMTWIDERCRQAGVRLVPCLNGFGHMERFLRHDAYRHRAECPGGAPALLGDGIVGPTTLAPTADNAAFALELFRGVLDVVPSTRIHIGGDEPFELGFGRSAADVAARGKGAVYAEHLARLIQPLVDDGHEVLFWGDVLARSPEQVPTLPAGSTAVSWWYDAPMAAPPPIADVLGATLAERLGLPDDALAGFVAHTRAYAETDFPFWVAPGTSTWSSFVGRWPNARANIDDALVVGTERGARGVLLTDWGDNGHHQPLPISLLPLAHAAGAAWCAATHEPDAVPAVVDRLTGVERGPSLGGVLVDLGRIDALLGVPQFNASAVHAALLGRLRAPRRHRLTAATVGEADAVLRRASKLDLGAGDERVDIIASEVRAAALLARIGLRRLAGALDVPAPDIADDDLDLHVAVRAQRAAWLRSSRPGGLGDSLARLAPLPGGA